MRLIYTDEAGNTGLKKDPDQPLHMIGALIVPDAQVRPVETAFDALVQERFGRAAADPDFEMHGSALFRGNDHFAGVPPAERVRAVMDLVAMLNAHGVKFGWAAVDKMKTWSPMHPHQRAFALLLERIEDHLRSVAELGLIVADENKEIQQKVIADLESYKRSDTQFGWRPTPIRNIIDSVHFVRSVDNRLIQCADVMTYFSMRAHRLNRQLTTTAAASGHAGALADWVDANATSSQKAVLSIEIELAKLTIFSKVFP